MVSNVLDRSMEEDLERGTASADGHAILKEWERMCEERAEMHAQSSVHYATCNKSVVIPAIVVSTIASIANIAISSSSASVADGSWWVVGFSALGLVTTAALTLAEFLGLSQLETRNVTSAGEYKKLALEIRMQTAIPIDGASYRSLSELVKGVKRQIDKLIDTSPGVPGHIERRVSSVECTRTMQRDERPRPNHA